MSNTDYAFLVEAEARIRELEEQLERSRKMPDRWQRLAEVAHHVLVILDDWFCDEFNFSRKARGKCAE